ncbi:uncharacterized protein F5Z01DRAFT_736844 [Emericellopsis atlantica]|uniref:Uncharacterized protein n=1 Tax=Emericellopsis atlantica TaxID=2614577 RepID=A0A9P7ZLQ3_9HYPO|nr:uncharacterized protein F5Z01DRAFT_736844 [Emericellopsis atlantica]KAG9254017.1 hypothetical protein F5Z01DRAFT_736844 [Emericellopsis atlantica]
MAKPKNNPADHPFISINGEPVEHKKKVAEELHRLIPQSGVLDMNMTVGLEADKTKEAAHHDHLLEVSKECRRVALEYVATQDSQPHLTYIFANSRASDAHEFSIKREIQAAARKRGSPFISVILDPTKTGAQEATSSSRDQAANPKIRVKYATAIGGGWLRFSDESPALNNQAKEVAEKIKDHVDRCLREGNAYPPQALI